MEEQKGSIIESCLVISEQRDLGVDTRDNLIPVVFGIWSKVYMLRFYESVLSCALFLSNLLRENTKGVR